VYPHVRLRSWDGGMLTVGELVAGFEAAIARGRGVINISLGSPRYSPALAHAVYAAVNAGSLVVAAAGNDRQLGNPDIFPGSLPHVLTVGAIGRSGAPSSFSSRSRAVDIAAPGEQIVVAVPSFFSSTGYLRGDGTSFAAPIVAGAAAWVWTERPRLDASQLFELLRSTARDVSPLGRDAETGYGVLDVPAALAGRAPNRDPQEPNDDVDLVRPRGVFRTGKAPLLRPRQLVGRLSARLDATEDGRDVYRIWLPARARATALVTGTADVDLAIWSPQARTVLTGGAARKRTLIASSGRSGINIERAGVRNRGPVGAYYYVAVSIGRGIPTASYRLSVSLNRSTVAAQ
ncbi:MAG: S8 family serine peptidase, partial [Actinomycetota bacterium]|nr:S8 family serine peptidase [Actinomycetota bacterium]